MSEETYPVEAVAADAPESAVVYAILPYVTTSAPVSICGLAFRSIDDLTGHSEEDRENLSLLSKIFYRTHGAQISKMVYAVQRITLEDHRHQRRAMIEAHILLTYVVGSFLTAEHTTIFMLQRTLVSEHLFHTERSSDFEFPEGTVQEQFGKQVPSFTGTRNFKHHTYVTINGKLFPPCNDPFLNDVQDLRRDLAIFLSGPQNWALQRFVFSPPDENKRGDAFFRRVFRALEWYNQSCASSLDKDDVALIFLAIAFESLLDTDLHDIRGWIDPDGNSKQPEGKSDKAKEPFVQALHVLLGHVPRLDDWARQFYDARSAIVHKGETPYLHFVFPSPDKGQKEKTDDRVYVANLNDLGRRIFRMCVAAKLSAHYSALDADLVNQMRHNESRLKWIIQKLVKKSKSAAERLKEVAPVIRELDRGRYMYGEMRVVRRSVLLQAANLLLKLLPEVCELAITNKASLEGELETINKQEDPMALVALMGKILTFIPANLSGDSDHPVEIIRAFIAYADDEVLFSRPE